METKNILSGKCPYCEFFNQEIIFDPKGNKYTERCDFCEKYFFIRSIGQLYSLIPTERVSLEMVQSAFQLCTTIHWDRKDFDKITQDIFKDIKGLNTKTFK